LWGGIAAANYYPAAAAAIAVSSPAKRTASSAIAGKKRLISGGSQGSNISISIVFVRRTRTTQAASPKTDPNALSHHVTCTHPHALANFVERCPRHPQIAEFSLSARMHFFAHAARLS
jgi:hypothetical protein